VLERVRALGGDVCICVCVCVCVCVQRGHYATTKLLLECGADPSKADTEMRTPLHAAARYKHTGAVRVLVSNGAPVDAQVNAFIYICTYIYTYILMYLRPFRCIRTYFIFIFECTLRVLVSNGAPVDAQVPTFIYVRTHLCTYVLFDVYVRTLFLFLNVQCVCLSALALL